MHILRKNTDPIFEIVPRKKLDVGSEFSFPKSYFFHLKNEYTNSDQVIESIAQLLPNENYLITMFDFPIGKTNEKFSFELKEETTNEIVLIGQLMIVDENEVVQDYSKKTNTKYTR
jgi:hypothetical protein